MVQHHSESSSRRHEARTEPRVSIEDYRDSLIQAITKTETGTNLKTIRRRRDLAEELLDLELTGVQAYYKQLARSIVELAPGNPLVAAFIEIACSGARRLSCEQLADIIVDPESSQANRDAAANVLAKSEDLKEQPEILELLCGKLKELMSDSHRNNYQAESIVQALGAASGAIPELRKVYRSVNPNSTSRALILRATSERRSFDQVRIELIESGQLIKTALETFGDLNVLLELAEQCKTLNENDRYSKTLAGKMLQHRDRESIASTWIYSDSPGLLAAGLHLRALLNEKSCEANNATDDWCIELQEKDFERIRSLSGRGTERAELAINALAGVKGAEEHLLELLDRSNYTTTRVACLKALSGSPELSPRLEKLTFNESFPLALEASKQLSELYGDNSALLRHCLLFPRRFLLVGEELCRGPQAIAFFQNEASQFEEHLTTIENKDLWNMVNKTDLQKCLKPLGLSPAGCELLVGYARGVFTASALECLPPDPKYVDLFLESLDDEVLGPIAAEKLAQIPESYPAVIEKLSRQLSQTELK